MALKMMELSNGVMTPAGEAIQVRVEYCSGSYSSFRLMMQHMAVAMWLSSRCHLEGKCPVKKKKKSLVIFRHLIDVYNLLLLSGNSVSHATKSCFHQQSGITVLWKVKTCVKVSRWSFLTAYTAAPLLSVMVKSFDARITDAAHMWARAIHRFHLVRRVKTGASIRPTWAQENLV